MDKAHFIRLFNRCFAEAVQKEYAAIQIPSDKVIDASWLKMRERLEAANNKTHKDESPCSK